MRTTVIQSPQSAAAVEWEIPRPREGEALLKMICGGIYGNDLASYWGMSAYVSYPRIIGHRFVAEVVEAGDNVCGIKPGMIVTRNSYFNCGTCCSCRRGMVNCHVHNEIMDVQREDALSDYFAMSVGRFYDGQGTGLKELALIEPFCISCHGVPWASVKPGDKALAFDVGAAGILAGVATKSSGAWMYIADIAGEKAEAVARDFHPDGGFVNESRERLDAFMQEITGGGEFDITAETVGAPSIFLGYVQAAVSRGCTVVTGMAKHSVDFNFLELQRKELEIYGSRAAATADFAMAVKLVEDGFVDLKKLISRTYLAGNAAGTFRNLNQNYGEITKAEFGF